MESKDVLALVNAGFTKDEIFKLIGTATPETTQVPPVEAPKQETPAPETPEMFQSFQTALGDLLNEINSSVQNMQKANLLNSYGEAIKEKSAADVMAEILPASN